MSSASSSLLQSPGLSISSSISLSSLSRSSTIDSSTLSSSAVSTTRRPPLAELPPSESVPMSSSRSTNKLAESTDAISSSGSTSKPTSQSQSSRVSSISPSRPPSLGLPPPSGPAPPRPSRSVLENSQPPPRSTITSTITDTPESTFLSSVTITTTDSAGRIALTVPPAITVLSTSTGADGAVVTYTHVVANPTGGLSGNDEVGGSSFMSNHAQVAGVFLAVGVVIAGIILSVIFCWWRRNRSSRRRRWISEIQRPLPSPPDPFEDPRPPPSPMRAVYPDQPSLTNWDGRRHTVIEDEDPKPFQTGSLGLSGLGPVYQQHGMGIAITSPSPELRKHSQVSLVQSSPSIYPATLPAAPDDSFFDSVEQQELPSVPIPAPVPPRPPRSLLRDYAARKSVDYNPMTPPPSESAHSDCSSKPPSPVLDRQPSLTRRRTSYEDVLNRRTLLDVRPKKDRL